jgi:hypothetical protein
VKAGIVHDGHGIDLCHLDHNLVEVILDFFLKVHKLLSQPRALTRVFLLANLHRSQVSIWRLFSVLLELVK